MALADRLRKNMRHLQKWARRQQVTCFRVYDHDIPEYPLVIEIYEGRVVGYLSFRRVDSDDEERAGYRRRVSDQIVQALQPQELILKDRGVRPGGSRAPGAASERLDVTGAFMVREGGLSFEVNLHSHHDSGLFLDQRQTREMVRQRAAGRRVLNLFCYTGSFSVYAAAGGAASVTSVDMSRTYLDWTWRNYSRNGLDAPHTMVQDDVLQWLPLAAAWEQEYDLIICDPPTFSNSKRMSSSLDIGRDHPRLIHDCRRLLAPQGELFFSTNAQHFHLHPDLAQAEELTRLTCPEDYRRRPGHRCWRFPGIAGS